MNANAQRIKERYNPERDIARGSDGRSIYVTWTERALLDMIESQQVQIDALKFELAAFRGRVTAAVPSTGSPNLCWCGKSKPADRACCADCHHRGELSDLQTSEWLE